MCNFTRVDYWDTLIHENIKKGNKIKYLWIDRMYIEDKKIFV